MSAQSRRWSSRELTYLWLATSIVGIVTGGVLWASGSHDAAHIAWAATTAIGLVPLAWETLLGLWRRETGVDLIALLAMAGSLALQQYLAGAVIALMLAGGEALERFANGRARRELAALLSRAPHVVHRYEGGSLVARGVSEVGEGDRLLVKPGDVVPVDGTVASGDAVLDE